MERRISEELRKFLITDELIERLVDLYAKFKSDKEILATISAEISPNQKLDFEFNEQALHFFVAGGLLALIVEAGWTSPEEIEPWEQEMLATLGIGDDCLE